MRNLSNAENFRQMRRSAGYAARYPNTEAGREADGWAKYFAGQIIGGTCPHCRERNGAHAYRCPNHSAA